MILKPASERRQATAAPEAPEPMIRISTGASAKASFPFSGSVRLALGNWNNESGADPGYTLLCDRETGMNERLSTIKAAKLGAVLGILYGLFQIVTQGQSVAGGADHLARAAGSLIGSMLLGAFMLAVSAALINFISRTK